MARTTITGKQIGDDSIVLGVDTSGTLPVNEGGTNATTASDARTNLGLAIGADVQAYNANTTTLGNTTTGTGAIVRATSPALTTPTGIVKGDVGLGNVDNTSDATKNSATATLTNKRITPRVQAVTSSATVTPNADTDDLVVITAQAAGLTIASPSGTPTQGQKLMIRIKDNGTARGITWNAIFRAIGVTLPTTTVISKTHYIGAVYNSTDTKWDVLAVGAEA